MRPQVGENCVKDTTELCQKKTFWSLPNYLQYSLVMDR